MVTQNVGKSEYQLSWANILCLPYKCIYGCALCARNLLLNINVLVIILQR